MMGMTENKRFDYRVIELKCHMDFDYMENDTFEEFYLKLMELCEEYNIHLSTITRRADVMLYEEELEQ